MNAILFKKLVNVFTLLSFFMWNLAVAAPQGGNVVAGSASINQAGTLTTVTQTSQNAVINWNGFNTASNESVHFVQPGPSSIALNRITSGLPTTFAGSLSANGQVWILNPAGVLFTSTAKIDVAGLLASTHDIANTDFMSGHYNFNLSNPNSTASVINNGQITVADTGMVALVAPGVENNGIIQANLGKVTLASGTAFVLDLYGDQLINFGNSAPVQNGYVSNAGKIVANGGKVYLTANSAAKVVDNVINMSGVIEARSVSSSHGMIVLNGGHHGRVHVSGRLDTSNTVAGAKGGFIETSGEVLVVEPTVEINPGMGGTWLLDPTVLIIGDPLAAVISSDLGTGVFESATADFIYVESAITQAAPYNFSTLKLSATTLLQVDAAITLTNGNLWLETTASSILTSLIINDALSVTNGYLKLLSNTGTLLEGSITATNLDFVEIFANQNIKIDGPITTNNAYLDIEAGYLNNNFGDLTINSGGVINATDSSVYLSASNAVEIGAPITISGESGGNLNVYATFGWDYGLITVDSGAPINVTNGNVFFSAYNEIDTNDTITVSNGGAEFDTSRNDININSDVNITNGYFRAYPGDDFFLEAPLTVTNDASFSIDVEANHGSVYIDYPVSLTNGDANFSARDYVYINDTVDITNGGLNLETDRFDIDVDGDVTITGSDNAYFDAFAGGTIYLGGTISVTNSDGFFDFGDFAVDVEAGCWDYCGSVYITSPIMLDGGDAYIYAPHQIHVDDTITVANGGLELSTDGAGNNIYINEAITVDNYLDLYPGNNIHVDAPLTVNFGGVDIEAGNNVYLNAPIIANDDTYIYGNTIYVNAGITVNNGGLTFETSFNGPIYINTTDPIMSDYTQYYYSRVILGTDGGTVTITSNLGNVKFYSTVDSWWWLDVPASLTVNVPNGYVRFMQNVGDDSPLNNLVINGATQFRNWCSSLDVITFLSQIYNGPVTSNTDMLLLTIQNGAIFLSSGYSAPDNQLILVTGENSDFIGGGIFGDSINVFALDLSGAGSADLTNTIVNGFGGADAFGQATLGQFVPATGNHYCVNGVGIGGCGAVVLPPIDLVTQSQTFIPPITIPTDIWNITVTDADGNTIETCTEDGCVITIVK